MDSKLFAAAIDQAIARVAKAEYTRLSSGKSPMECAEAVAGALNSWASLRSGIQPEYNEWEALFYLTWYQPHQINLALAIIRHFLAPPQPLHIIDVGCGALATQVAMAVAVSENTARSPDAKSYEVHGIDPSYPMRNIGQLLWSELRSIIKKESKLSFLRRIFKAVGKNSRVYGSLKDYYRSDFAYKGDNYPSMNCLLTAFHAIYSSNMKYLQQDFSKIRKNSYPANEAVTCHQINLSIAKQICRSDASEKAFLHNCFVFHGTLPKTTLWRRQIRDRLIQELSQHRQIIENFLFQEVIWDPTKDNRAILWSSSFQRGTQR